MGYNPDEIEEILKRYTGGGSSASTPSTSESVSDAGKLAESVSSFDALKTEPVKPEPVKTEPVKPEPVKPEPVKAEPIKTEPIKTEPVKTEPKKTVEQSEPVVERPIYKEPVKKWVPTKKESPKKEDPHKLKLSGKSNATRSWSGEDVVFDDSDPDSNTKVSSGKISFGKKSTAESSASNYSSYSSSPSGTESSSYSSSSNSSSSSVSMSSGTSGSFGSDKKEKVRVSRAEIMKKQETPEERKKKIAKNQARMKRKKRVNTVLNILLVFFILVFLGSAAYLGFYFYKIHKAQDSFDSLKAMIKDNRSVNPQTGKDDHNPDADYITYDTIDGVTVQSKFVDIYNMNKEFIGWLTIPDTNIDYPVMYTPADEQKYLHLDFDQNYSSSGTLFVAKSANPIKPSDNVLIYGHNMKAGTMFHSLLSYEKEEFYQAHKTFEFDTLSDDGKYEVIAAFRTQIDEDDPSLFKYYESFNFSDEKSFDEYVEKAKSLTPYTIDTTAKYGDKLLTLSTCAYHTNEGRYVIVAKKVKNDKEN